MKKLILFVLFACSIASAQICAPPKDSLFVWLKADALCKVNDDTVSVWYDSSGSGVDRDPRNSGSSTTVPHFKSNYVNGLPALYFDGGDVLTWPNNTFGAFTEAEMFIVVRDSADPATNINTSGLWDFTTHSGSACTDANTHFPYTDGVIYDGAFSTTRKNVGNPSPSMTSWRVYNVRSKTGEWTASLDTAQLFTTATSTFVSNTGERIGVDCTTYYLQGWIAEILIYDHIISAANRTSAWAYLGQKYGLAYTTANYGSPCPSCASAIRQGRIINNN